MYPLFLKKYSRVNFWIFGRKHWFGERRKCSVRARDFEQKFNELRVGSTRDDEDYWKIVSLLKEENRVSQAQRGTQSHNVREKVRKNVSEKGTKKFR